MKRLVTMVLSFMLGTSLFADNELLVGDLNLSATVDQIGGASITIPIEVPAGVNGMQPNLALIYNSHSGYGLAGWGWDLAGISSIQRTGNTFYHDSIISGVTFSNSDNLLLDGERLILTSGYNHGVNSIYHTERESFNQVTCQGGFCYSVQSKDGRIALYGTNGVNLLSSYISQVTDANGNYMTYDYNCSDTREITINKIKYTYNTSSQAKYTVEFKYIDAPNVRTHYIGESLTGSFLYQSKLLSKINIKSGNKILYSYNFAYDTNRICPQLVSVEKTASNGDKYPATVITWNTTTNKPEVTTSLPQNREEKTVFGDFNQDGKTDFISYSPNSSIFIIYTNTTSNGILSFQSTTFNSGHSFQDLRAADYNGDGRTDLVGRYVEDKKNRVTYLIASGTGFNTYTDYIELSKENFLVGDFDGDGCDEIINPENNKMYSFGAGHITLPQIEIWDSGAGRIYSMGENCVPLDFNGNGKTDIILTTSSHYYIFEYDSATSLLLERYSARLSSIYSYGELANVKFGDFNGDGKTDILSIYEGENYSLLGTVYYNGVLQAWTEELISPFIQIADINQDGMDDIVHLATHMTENKAYVCVGISKGEGFVYDNQVLASYTSANDINRDDLFYRDMYGTGACDLIYLKDDGSVMTKQLYAEGAMLVDKVTDGMGNIYDFTYKSIANSNVYTNTRVGGASVNPLVQPFYVVSDYTAPYTSLSYHYKNGRYHTRGKGFLGFEGLTVTDNLNNTISNIVNGITSKHLHNYPVSTTVLSMDGDTISFLKNRYTVREMGGKCIFSHHSGYEYTDHLTGLKETCVSIYDNNGNLDHETKTRGDWVERSEYNYLNAGSWCPNKVSSSLTYNTYNGSTSPFRRTFYKYDTRGNLIRQTIDTLYTDTYRLVRQYTYDTFGNVTKEVVSGTGQTRTRSYTYSTDGRFLLTSTDELGQTTTNTYNSDWGTLLTQTTNAGVTKNSYDSFGRLWKTIAPDSVVYTISSQFVSGVPNVRYMAHETRTNSAPVTTYYNAAGKPLFIKKMGHNDRQIYTAYTYFPNGQDKLISEPYFSTGIVAAASQTFTSDNATLYTYDEYQRPLRVASPQGITLYTYNGLATIVNAQSMQKTTKLNNSGFTEYEQTGLGPTPLTLSAPPSFEEIYKKVSYTYYPTGQVKTATPDGGSAVTMEYDVQGNRTKLIDPDAGTITNTYNAFGQVLTRSQNVHGGTPVVTAYSYDASNGRLKSETATGDTVITTTYSYNSTFKDRPYKINGDGGYSYYMYDDFGNATAYQKSYKGKTTRLRSYYDKNLVTKSQMVLANSWVYYTYDAYGNMTTEKFNTTLAWELLEQNARGQVVRERKGGVVTTYTYDNCGRITSIVAPNIVSLHYTYDIHGNVLTKTDAVNNQSIEYTYDHLMRLTSWTVNDNDTQSITYDAATGNIISKTDLGTSTEFSYSSSSKPHALRGVSGITGTDWGVADISIDYTDFSKVKSIQCGTDSYDVFYGVEKERFRTQKTVSGATTTRYYMPNHELVVDSLGHETYIIYLCNGSIAVHDKAAGAKTLYHGYYDAQGSLIALTDNSGNVLARYAYDPWGKRVGAANWAYSPTYTSTLNIDRGYTMHEHLDEFDLINMNGRVYDPAVAQFLSPDPYIQDAGNWLNYNRYAYCYNNPTRYVDPDGEWIQIVIGAVICGAINVWANQDACDGIGQVMAAFGAGALAYGLIAATGGATSGLLATTGAGFASAAIGGATLSGTNNLIAQTGEGFSGQVNWNDVGINALSGSLSGVAGYAGSQYIGPYIGTTISNTVKVNSPMIASGINGMAAGFMGGAAAGYVGNYVLTGDYHMASQTAIYGGVYGGITGFAGGVDAGYRYAKEHNLNKWNGKSLNQLKYSKHQVGTKFSKHSKDYPGLNHEDYLNLAKDIYGNPLSIKIDYPLNSPNYPGETHYIHGGNLLRMDPYGYFRSLYPINK